ncbi:MAG UNVERIFIED_CONTAM: hypothetical protein LVR18_27400 [Planctomycetaceae bacterium]|jgi:hypothetical protein
MEVHFAVIGDAGEGWRESVPVVPVAGDLVQRGNESFRVAHRTFVAGLMQVMLVPINHDFEEIPY